MRCGRKPYKQNIWRNTGSTNEPFEGWFHDNEEIDDLEHMYVNTKKKGKEKEKKSAIV